MVFKISILGSYEYYAITFGIASESFLQEGRIVTDFGLKVAMNICDPVKLRSIRKKTHDTVTMQAEQQASSDTDMTGFFLDGDKDFLRALSGSAMPSFDYINSFSGKESITIKIKHTEEVDLLWLINIIIELGGKYNDNTYQSLFPWYDKYKLVSDKVIIENLNTAMFEDIKNNRFDKIHLAPPDLINYEVYDFSYCRRTEDLTNNISFIELVNSNSRFNARSSIDTIKKWRIHPYNSDTSIFEKPYNAYDCIVAEIEYEGDLYVLSGGDWKCVSHEFVEEINNNLDDIQTVTPTFLPESIAIDDVASGKKTEAIYNEKAVERCSDLLLFDKQKMVIAGQKYYEICDMFHHDKIFIHVKRYAQGSASISHLFVQCRFYTSAFISDRPCRNSIREFILTTPNANYFLDLIPKEVSEIVRKDYCVMLCVLYEGNQLNKENLPFMAKYELVNAYKHINGFLNVDLQICFRKVL